MFEGFDRVEVIKALHSLEKGKAAGPDGFMIKISRNLSSLISPIVQLFNIILESGHPP